MMTLTNNSSYAIFFSCDYDIGLNNTHIICKEGFAVVGICEHCTGRSALTVFKGNCWSVKFDRPGILVSLSSGAYMRRWPLHPHGPWDVSSFHWCSPPAWLPLKGFWPLLWCTMWSHFGFRRFCVSHVIGEEWVIIGQRFCTICLRESKRKSCAIRFRHSWVALGAALRCGEAIFLKMPTAGSWTHVSQGWWGWWDLLIILFWVCMICCIVCGESGLCSFSLCMVWIAIPSFWTSLWLPLVHLHYLNVLLHASIFILYPERSYYGLLVSEFKIAISHQSSRFSAILNSFKIHISHFSQYPKEKIKN